MKRLIILLTIVIVASLAEAKVDLVTIPTRDTVQLTIYNSADLTLARDSRALTLKKGKNKLQFSWANTLIDPTSLEMLTKANSDKIFIEDLVYPPRTQFLGIWNVTSDISAPVPVEITYLTSGLSWRAFYMGTLTKDEKTMRLQGYVRVTNNSGEDYENAQTRLIVGKVHLLDEIARLARRKYPYESPIKIRRALGVEIAGVAALAEAPMAKKKMEQFKSLDLKEIKKEGLSEYFLYTIEGTETIPTGWSKRLPSLQADNVPVINLYKYEQQRYGDSVIRFINFKNNEKHKLGDTPIPGGILKVYQTADEKKHLSYVGQSEFKYIPVNEDVELNLGPVADVTVKPTLMNYVNENYEFDPNDNITSWDEVQTFIIKLKNTRDVPVKIELQRNFKATRWNLATRQDYEKIDLDTVKFTLTMAPRSEQQFEYVLTIPHEIRFWGSESLVGYWKFDETTGNTARDSSGRNHHGNMVHGAPLWDKRGKFDGCLNFNETYGVAIPKQVFSTIDKAITISVWTNGDENQTNAENVILQTSSRKGGKSYIVTITTRYQDDGRIEFAAGNDRSDEVMFNASTRQWAGRWNHYAFTKDAEKAIQRIYINGNVVAEKTNSNSSMSGVENARIAIAPDRYGDQYIGRLDDMRIYDKALSPEQIRQIHQRGQ
ncbi:MAG: LamG-like jellyroll fold domain-containing protein [Planctomycetota bacterium]|jgi:hypothetical protein